LPSVDIVLTMVPPGLSLSLSIGIEYAQSRLNRKSIVALKGRLINAAGRMKAVFFDKTGTLTINEMKLDSVYFCPEQAEAYTLVEMEEYQASLKAQEAASQAREEELILQNFATNHSLSLIKGELLGDPMEDELFRFSRSSMVDQHADSAPADPDEPAHLRKVHFPGSLLAKKTHIYEFGQPVEMHLLHEGTSRPLFVLSVWDFKSALQRMSVVVRDSKDAATYVFTKGAPEKVVQLCRPESLPDNVQNTIRKFTKHGYRVLAFGYKKVDGSNLEVPTAHQTRLRDHFESELTFQGIALFKNNLKEQTKPTILNLKRADFRVGMITGDNINTAISIAKNCRIVEVSREEVFLFGINFEGEVELNPIEENLDEESFETDDSEADVCYKTLADGPQAEARVKVGAIDADSFKRICTHLNLEEEGKEIDPHNPVIKELAKKCRIFARMNPEQKALIIKIMKAYHKTKECTVGFCGDGANDCIALKEADIGVSLSKTEASLSAPFISGIEDISCVEHISLEGKAALTTNFDSFRFFCLYSIVQTIGLLVLFAQNTEYSDGVYITCDIIIALNLANCIGLLQPLKKLTAKMPECTLFYPELLISIAVNCLLGFGCVLAGIPIIKRDPNYIAPDKIRDDTGGKPDNHVATWETTVALAHPDGRIVRDADHLRHCSRL